MKKYIIIAVGLSLAACNSKKDASVDQLLQSNDTQAMQLKLQQIQSQTDSLHKLENKLRTRIESVNPGQTEYVKAITVKDTVYRHFIKIQANIETEQDVQVTPEYGGVLNLLVKEGQYVKRGQLIARISDGGLSDQLNQAKISVDQAKSQLQQAEIQRDLAKTTFMKQQSLWNKKIGSEIQYLQAKTNYETSEKSVIAARQQVQAAQKGVSGVNSQLAKTQLRAPFSGRVEQIITQSGQVVGPGMPVIRLVNPSDIRLKAYVPESYISNIGPGTLAEIYVPSLDETFTSKVSRVSSSINPANRSFEVEVKVPDSDAKLKPNSNAQLSLNDYTAEKAIVLNVSAIRHDAKGAYVYVVENEKAKKSYVTIGEESNGMVEIEGGIQTGEVVITEAPSKLEEGNNVKISK
ncbi:efflux RND transporter periplasmic adaptor subunit [Weeksellaceae bacterium TAE3-ERU29]|nr:efflux RND transporter periplasmic adaptor subunit [Weeksellaceae bacterium TAE3-ERU29]